MNITPISGYDPSFSWQVGFNSISSKSNTQEFRATIRPLHGMELFTRIPNNVILYEETGILINSTTNQGQWAFPLSKNSVIAGGPFRDYQVVIEAYDLNGYTSAGNKIGSIADNENGWIAYSEGYDIIAITNPRQTGIEMSNNLPTQDTIISGMGNTGLNLHSGHGYSTLNYMGTHGEINIRYLDGLFNSNLVGGYIYAWTGKFPKRETLLRISGYDSVSKSQFNFDPTLGYIYHPTAAMAFRGANSIYVSLSFYDNLDQEAIDNGIDISTGLYLSDNAICYNDIAAGSINIGGFQSIYSMQYTGNLPATGVLGTGVFILAQQYYNGTTSVLYLANPIVATGYNNYSGYSSLIGGGAGGNSVLLNNVPISNIVNFLTITLQSQTDDEFSIYLNNNPIKDDSSLSTDGTYFNILNLAASSGYSVKYGDTITFSGRDNQVGLWSIQKWTTLIGWGDGTITTITGGYSDAGASDFAPNWRNDGGIIVSKISGYNRLA